MIIITNVLIMIEASRLTTEVIVTTEDTNKSVLITTYSTEAQSEGDQTQVKGAMNTLVTHQQSSQETPVIK
jgi:hypothetical protein